MSIWHTVVWDSRFSQLFAFSGPIILRGNTLFELGRYREALQWFGTVSLAPHAHGYGWYRQAHAHEALGETDRAAELYRNFIRRWAEADPDLQPLVEDARQRLEALTE
jgi:tetratricopeptide (TPR) repeat protein